MASRSAGRSSPGVVPVTTIVNLRVLSGDNVGPGDSDGVSDRSNCFCNSVSKSETIASLTTTGVEVSEGFVLGCSGSLVVMLFGEDVGLARRGEDTVTLLVVGDEDLVGGVPDRTVRANPARLHPWHTIPRNNWDLQRCYIIHLSTSSASARCHIPNRTIIRDEHQATRSRHPWSQGE